MIYPLQRLYKLIRVPITPWVSEYEDFFLTNIGRDGYNLTYKRKVKKLK